MWLFTFKVIKNARYKKCRSLVIPATLVLYGHLQLVAPMLESINIKHSQNHRKIDWTAIEFDCRAEQSNNKDCDARWEIGRQEDTTVQQGSLESYSLKTPRTT